MQFQHLLAASRFLTPASPFASPVDEQAFQNDYRMGGYGFAVAVMFVGFFMAVSFIVIALLRPLEGTDATSLQLLRLMIGLACGLSFIALVSAPLWSMKHHMLTVFLPSFVALAGLGLLLFMPRPDGGSPIAFGRSTLSLIIAIWLISAFCRLPLRQIMTMSVSASLFNLAGLHQLGISHLPFFALDLLIANFTVWTLTIQIEKRERLLWFQSSKTQRALKRAERNINQATIINRVQNRLMQSIGHDIRQPLSSSSIYMNLVSSAASKSADHIVAANIERLAGCLRAVESTLNRMLDADVEHLTEADLATNRADLTGIFADLRHVFEPQAMRQGIKLRFSSATSRPHLARTHESALLEILNNVISNALKYSAVRRGGGGVVMVGVVATSDAVRIDILDNGIGIPSNLHKRIFEEGFRTPEAIEKQDGAGLGLTIVESMVQRLPDHRLRLRSQPGQGTRIRLYLPPA